MLRDMMKSNTHRVDYLNFKSAGTNGSFAIYVRGCLNEGQSYCSAAKRRLFICLDYVRRTMEEKKLVAVYMDIYDLENSNIRAFQELEADLRKGMIEKVLFADLEEIFKDPVLSDKMLDLIECVENIEFFDVDGNVFEAKKIPLNQLIGV
ncbi:MAG: hypothetical protein RBT01_07605 [Anaerolineaceae bacterium]|jgi:hypothetical protein|nr:hypothetical protein [Anaerolineaceae bacterium]